MVAVFLMVWSDVPNWTVWFISPFISIGFLFFLTMIVIITEKFIEKSKNFQAPPSQKFKASRFKLPQKPEEISCIACGSDDIAIILYGLPTLTSKLEKAILDQKITLGGRNFYDDSPQWICNICDYKFGKIQLIKKIGKTLKLKPRQ